MSTFNVELKKVVDDSYEIEIGYDLKKKLVNDIEKGLVGKIRKFAVITDSNVADLYAKPISEKTKKVRRIIGCINNCINKKISAAFIT